MQVGKQSLIPGQWEEWRVHPAKTVLQSNYVPGEAKPWLGLGEVQPFSYCSHWRIFEGFAVQILHSLPQMSLWSLASQATTMAAVVV